MSELIQRFMGKNCVLYISGSLGGDLEGVVEALEGNWISVRTQKGNELINLDYICRIKEKPAKK